MRRQLIPITSDADIVTATIIAEQNQALGAAFAALSNIRDWAHHEYLGGCRVGNATLAELLDKTIEGLAR